MAEERQFFKGPSREHDRNTGLSHFILSTSYIDSSGKPAMIQLHGLLSEMPEISFTVNYEEGPGSEWQDILANFTANDLISVFNAIGAKGDNFRNIVKSGTWTKQVYAGYSPSTIPLKFRLYTRDLLGQSSPEMWKLWLSKFATIDSKNEFTVDRSLQNILGSVVNAYNSGEKTAEVANQAAASLQKHSNKQEPNKTDAQKNADDAQTAMMKVYTIKNAVNKYFADTIMSANSSKSKWKISEMNLFEKSSFFGGTRYIYLKMKITSNNNDSFFEEKGAEVGITSSVTAWDHDYKVEDINIDYDKIEKAIKNTVGKVTEDKKDIDNIFSNGFYSGLKSCFDDATLNQNNTNNSNSQISSFLTNTVNALGDTLTAKYGEYRVYEPMNRANCLGEKLWNLNIFDNVIFNKAKPLVVYISSWSYKPSEEMDGNEHVYYDFDITCAMDQIYSRNTWYKILKNEKNTSEQALIAANAAKAMEGYGVDKAAAAAMAGYAGDLPAKANFMRQLQ